MQREHKHIVVEGAGDNSRRIKLVISNYFVLEGVYKKPIWGHPRSLKDIRSQIWFTENSQIVIAGIADMPVGGRHQQYGELVMV